MKNGIVDLDAQYPTEYRYANEVLGWSTKAVDTLADRIRFRTFENDLFGMNQIFDMNNKDILIDSAILGALITACDFIYISKGKDDFPRLQVIDGFNATGVIDPITNMMTEGYAVLSRDVETPSRILTEAYFTQEETIIYDKVAGIETRINNPAPYCLLVPVINRPDARRQFGHSRITRSCMALQQAALRTLRLTEVSAEFYSYPQKYVLGTNPDDEPLDKYRAAVSTMLEISADQEGNTPTLGQFNQQTMGPYTDQIKMLASLFAGETGLTLDDLGFVTENPSSAESIKAAHENLRLCARKAQKDFSVALINTGYLATCVRDDEAYFRNAFYETKVKFEPIFEPDMNTISLIGDGAIKVNQAVPGYFNKDNLRELTGIEASKQPTTNVGATNE